MKILIVDDDELMHETFKAVLKAESLYFSKSFDAAEKLLENESFDAAFLDIQLKSPKSNENGIELLRLIQQKDQYLPCIMISGSDEKDDIAHCLKLGAVDYIVKGTVNSAAYNLALYKASLWRKLKSESQWARETPRYNSIKNYGMLGESPLIKDLLQNIQRVGRLPGPFLILGATGTGKELVARALWQVGRGEHRPFVAINCASLPENLIEGELFGYERGAFTGAHTARAGLFEAANGGDIFLDEIGELSKDLQAKFLRVLQESKVRRLGSDKERPINVRVIAATNVDLIEAVQEGEFREDLFYRLCVHQLKLPSLKARRDDIIPILESFMVQNGMGSFEIESDAKKLLMNFEWPGNVRQLKAFSEYIRGYPDVKIITKNIVTNWVELNSLSKRDMSESDSISELKIKLAQGEGIQIDKHLSDVQRSYVEAALLATNSNRSQAARLLGISRQRFSNWLSELGIV